MVWWNYKKLAADLRDGLVTPKQYRNYQIFFWVGMLFSLPSLFTQPVMFIGTVGLWIAVAYTVNKKGDGRDFYRRLICTDLPITLRAGVVALAILLPGMAMVVLSGGMTSPEAFNGVGMVAELLSLCYYYAILIKAFQIAAHKASAA